MNRNFLKATALVSAVIGLATTALAQTVPEFPPAGWVGFCLDPTSTTSPYSDPYDYYEEWNDLFGIFLGLGGTANFSKYCFPTNGITNPNTGRIGQMTGPVGSVQDIAYTGNQFIDSWLYITMGMPDAVTGNWGYATVVTQAPGATTTTRAPFGGSSIDTYYYGASDRYYVAESTSGSIRVILRVDILGNAGRLQWSLINLSAAQIQVGLEYGEWVNFFEPLLNGPTEDNTPNEFGYVVVPGLRPLYTDRRFSATPNLNATAPHEYQLPSKLDISISQRHGYGLDVPLVTDPTIPDQTPVDILDVGKAGFLLGDETGSSEPMPAAYSNPSPILEDTTFTGDIAFVQRWLPTSGPTLNAYDGAYDTTDTRVITAYYRDTWGSADYTQPYNVTLDAPVVITNANDPFTFDQNPVDIRVYIDNTRGYSSIDAPIPLEDVQVTLNLPQGMTSATDGVSSTATQYIASVPPTTHTIVDGFPISTPMSYVDFMVNVDPTLFGTQGYSVTIVPNPGQTKTLTGTINVASQPKLLLNNTSELISTPWTFTTGGDWNTVLNLTALYAANPNLVVQTFSWDAVQQAYVLQTQPQRSVGTWIVSNQTLGPLDLQGGPVEPGDLVAGAPTIDLKSGWNLIANPYNYQIPIGQMVGVSGANPSTTQTYEALASQGIISPTLAYWDDNTQSYDFTVDFNDTLIPNRGYWVYVSTAQDVTLSFGPLYTPYVPIDRPSPDVKIKDTPYVAPQALWKLQLAIKAGRVQDLLNYVGVAKVASQVRMATLLKPPASPLPTAVSGSVQQVQGTRTVSLAQSLLANAPSLSWNWNVFTRSAVKTTISWPNISSVPSNTDVVLVDLATKQSIDMRKSTSYTFQSKADSNRQFQIVANVKQTEPPITAFSARTTGFGFNSSLFVSYSLNAAASTTVTVLQGSKTISVLQNKVTEGAGSHSLNWYELGSNDKRVPPGYYTVQISATAAGQTAQVKTVSVYL